MSGFAQGETSNTSDGVSVIPPSILLPLDYFDEDDLSSARGSDTDNPARSHGHSCDHDCSCPDGWEPCDCPDTCGSSDHCSDDEPSEDHNGGKFTPALPRITISDPVIDENPCEDCEDSLKQSLEAMDQANKKAGADKTTIAAL